MVDIDTRLGRFLATGLAAAVLSVAVLSAPVCAQDLETSFAISGQDLGAALRSFALASGRDVVFDPALVKGKTTRGVSGRLALDDALKRLLAGSSLTYVRMSSGGFAIRSAPPPSTAERPPDSVAASINNVFAVNEIVVTGTAGSIDKFTAPFAVSTLKGEPILDKSPRSLVDLLRGQPGLVVENSGGEGGNENIVIRGLPFAGFRLIDVLEDGVPIYESNYERFMNIDSLFRVDLMTERAEVERGGTSSIFSNNAAGGVVNLITRHGTAAPEGAVQVEGGTAGLWRVQGYQSGPVNDNLFYSIGGSYRVDNGLRDQGFSPADNGGQIQVGATYLLPNGKVFADAKYLNDRSAFYTDIPLTNPLTGASLGHLINPNDGTLTSSSFEHVQIRTLNGTPTGAVVSRDLADGVHPDIATFTAGGDFDLGGGWTLGERARYVDGRLGIDGIFNAATPTSASTFLASYVAAAQRAFPGATHLDFSIVGSGTDYNPAATANLVMANNYDSARTEIRYVANDSHLARTFDLADAMKDDITVGLYASAYVYGHQELLNAVLQNVKSNPNALDIRALSASGAVLGYVTENGFLSYGAGSNNGSLNGVALAGYAENTVHITPRLQVDAGVRIESRQQKGTQGVLGTQVLSTTGPLAAQVVSGVVAYVPHREDLHGTAFTFGAAYDISSNLNGFVRYSQSYSFPAFITIISGATLPNGAPQPVSTVDQGEGGLKFKTSTFQAAATAYYAHFDQLSSTTQVAAADGSIANSSIVFNSTTIGLEAEADWRPARWFDLSGTVTLQDPKIDSVQTLTGPSAASQANGTVPRVPTDLISLEPAYLFNDGGWRGRVFADIYSVGKRFQDDSNLSVLPGYTTLDLGVTANPSDHVQLRLLVSNVTDAAGLTEGNARASYVNVGAVGNATVGRPIFGREATASITYRW
jgi:outer membrane receptor protein involved in Fe transport